VPVQVQRASFQVPNSGGSLTERWTPKVKAAVQTAGKPNAQASVLAQLQTIAISKC
jgi:hypothetical protein